MPRRVCHIMASAKGGVWMVEQLRELRRQFGYEVHAVVGDNEGPLHDVESGPGQECRAFELGLVDQDGVQVNGAMISGRREITLRLPLVQAETAWLRLTAPQDVPIPSDPRILNLRVFRLSWGSAFSDVPFDHHSTFADSSMKCVR